MLNDSNVTVATFEKKLIEAVKLNQNLVLLHKFSSAVPVQPNATLTVMLTAVDDTNRENFRNSTSISSKSSLCSLLSCKCTTVAIGYIHVCMVLTCSRMHYSHHKYHGVQ